MPPDSGEDSTRLRTQAWRARSLAENLPDYEPARERLKEFADELDGQAERLEGKRNVAD
jgi:hypothetical protein